MDIIEFVGFTDESYITDSRYRSITMLSYQRDSHNLIREEIKRILNESNVDEFKWQKLKDARYRFCAQKIIDFIFTSYSKYNLRIDTLIWDTQDSRHNVQGRDDTANYERMFFHLVSNVLEKRRNPNMIWNIFPDEKNDIDWETLNQCLERKGKSILKTNQLLGEICHSSWFYSIQKFMQVPSDKCVQIQIADLFSGLSVFSIDLGNDYLCWRNTNTPSLFCFDNRFDEKKLSNREENRFQILDHLLKRISEEKLSINFQNDKCLKTKYPKDFMNFWHYKPQHEYDIAPNSSMDTRL